MIRLTRQSDYAILLLVAMASDSQKPPYTANRLSALTGVQLPITQKILNRLKSQGVLRSQRGATGGYSMVFSPVETTITHVLTAMDGPIALTDCIADGSGACHLEPSCLIKEKWKIINQKVTDALSDLSIADLLDTEQNMKQFGTNRADINPVLSGSL